MSPRPEGVACEGGSAASGAQNRVRTVPGGTGPGRTQEGCAGARRVDVSGEGGEGAVCSERATGAAKGVLQRRVMGVGSLWLREASSPLHSKHAHLRHRADLQQP